MKKTDITGFPVHLRHEKIRVCGNIIERRSYLNSFNEMAIKKIDDTHYMIKSTGEICEYQKSTSRADNKWRMIESQANMRAIANANFKGGKNEMFKTLTYRENMQDTKRVYNDFRNYMAKLERRYNLRLSYLAVLEPQERGAWHLHVLIKRSDGERLYIPQKELLALWGHGSVTVQRIQQVDNVGAYLSGYLKKATRLQMYPPGVNFYRYTRDLKKPEWVNMIDVPWHEKAMLSDANRVHDSQKMIEDESGVKQIVRYQQYNIVRNQNNQRVVNK